MKKIVGLIIIIAILLLGAYYVMGYKTESSIKETISRLDEMKNANAKLVQYDRGWFTSKALIEWKLTTPARQETDEAGQEQTIPEENYEFKTVLDIHHGPIMFTNGGMYFGLGYGTSTMNLPENVKQKLNMLLSDKSDNPELKLNLYINYFNKVWLDWGIPEFALFAKDGDGSLKWYGMNSAFVLSSDFNNVEGNLNLEGFTLNTKDSSIELRDLSTDYDVHRIENGLYVGESSLELPKLIIKDKGATFLEVEDSKMHSESTVSDGLLEIRISLSVDKVKIRDQSYGPGKFEWALRNLDADTLAKIKEVSSSVADDSQMQQQQMMLALLPVLPKLISRGAEFEITTLSVKLPEGNLQASLKVTAPKVKEPNLFALMAQIKGQGRLQIPAAFLKTMLQKDLAHNQAAKLPSDNTVQSAESTPATTAPDDTLAAQQFIDKLISAGMLTTKGSDYVIEFSLQNGQFLVNGKPFQAQNLQL